MEGPTHPPFRQCLSLETRDCELDQRHYGCCEALSGPDYGEVNKKTLNHSGSLPNMETALEKIASRRYKTKMDKRSGLWQVDLTPNAQELLAFITPQGRVFKRHLFCLACIAQRKGV